jgi:YggT family protein
VIWSFIHLVLQVFLFALLGRIVLSWFPPSGPGALETIRMLLFRITEPVLAPIRNLLPPVRVGAMGLDLSPLIVFLVLEILMAALPN